MFPQPANRRGAVNDLYFVHPNATRYNPNNGYDESRYPSPKLQYRKRCGRKTYTNEKGMHVGEDKEETLQVQHLLDYFTRAIRQYLEIEDGDSNDTHPKQYMVIQEKGREEGSFNHSDTRTAIRNPDTVFRFSCQDRLIQKLLNSLTLPSNHWVSAENRDGSSRYYLRFNDTDSNDHSLIADSLIAALERGEVQIKACDVHNAELLT